MTRIFAAALLCALSTTPAPVQDIFTRIRSIDVTMRRRGPASPASTGWVTDTMVAGRPSASGFNTYALTAAHKTRRFSSYVTVTNKANGSYVLSRSLRPQRIPSRN
ncbi:hypothetical protein AB7783_12255 [Tardiphaga sp. 172_B4_N1_3]|uniref:hypothetical protein n=1 Tax=Tardiphaga sp. 172_B4_N1_3 TaxID=3240787 RepID=UPI003F887C33